jgi:hypothetical protein
MPKWNGGVIGVANNPTQSSAKGIWSLSEATKAIRAGLWPPSNAGADPYFENVTLLLPGDGTNGAQNNTFLDSSTNNFTITRNGNTTQGTFTPFSKADGRWGMYVGSAGYQRWDTSTNYSGTDLTIECWVYATASTSSFTSLVSSNSGTGNYTQYFNLAIDGSNRLACNVYGTSNTALNNTSTIPLNQWVHCAFVLTSGGTLSLYENGTRVATTTGASIASVSTNIQVGGIVQTSGGGYTSYFNGYISNARINKSAVYSGTSFTAPTAPLTADANTNLLVCQSNRIKDNGGANYSTGVNTVSQAVTTFSPFPSLTAYAAGTNGGSGYFDGTGDYLECSSNSAFSFGTGNFTVEAWIYRAASGTFPIFANGATSSGSFSLYVYNDKLEGGFYGGTTITGATSLAINAWNHVAIVRSGTTLSLYLNGTRDATTTSSSNNTSSNCVIARDWTNGSSYSNGYISNLRVVKGTAVYDPSLSTLTVPTAPLTAITNTSLLMSGTNAGIIDNAQDNNLETVGNAQISTTQSKFGGSSMYFDGNGDYLRIRDSQNFVFGTGDFTIEFWVYYNSGLTADVALFDGRPSGTNGVYPLIFSNTTGKLVWYINSAARITGTTTLSTGTWYHVAVARSGTSTKLFLNGTQESSTYTDSNSYLLGTDRPIIAAAGATLGADPLNGYIDDLRITKGYARYTANFTAPVGPFNGFGD